MINSAAWGIPNVALLSEEKNKYIGCEWWLARESWNVCSAPEFCELNSFPKPLCSPSPDVPEEDANEHILILQNHRILSKEPNRMSSSPANLLSDEEGLCCYKSSNRRCHNKKDAVFFFQNNRHLLIILMHIIIYFLIITSFLYDYLNKSRGIFCKLLETTFYHTFSHIAQNTTA